MFRPYLALLVGKISPAHRLSWCLCALISGIVISEAIVFAALSLWWLWLIVAIAIFCLAQVLLRMLPSLAPYFILIGWVLIGISCSGFEISRNSSLSILTETNAGIFSVEVEEMNRRAFPAIRIEGQILADYQTDPEFKMLERVRVSLKSPPENLKIGDQLVLNGRLFPLSPRGFVNSPDYGRHHWLEGIGASGFSWQTLSHIPASPTTIGARLARYRAVLSQRIMDRMEPQPGAIASAMLVGIRDRIDEDTYHAFRVSGLAHLLAISGLHMSIFCFAVMHVLRLAIALFPAYAMRIPSHKVAAAGALGAGFIYLCLTGFPVSAIRAFLMACIVILAILTDRLAFTFRNLAVVGIIILILSPSILFTASFQLSFIASFALVMIISSSLWNRDMNKIIKMILFLMTSSTLIIILSAPYTAWHFATISLWGICANIVAIPLTGFVIMPLGVCVLISSLFGSPFLSGAVMEAALTILIGIAEFFATLPIEPLTVMPPAHINLLLFLLCVLAFVSLSGIPKLAGIIGVGFILAHLVFNKPYDGAVFMQSQRPVMVINHIHNGTDKNAHYWLSNLKISDYYTYHLERHFGPAPQRNLDCLPDFCRTIYKGVTLGFVMKRAGLTNACKMNMDMLITPFKPVYPCRTPKEVVIVPLDTEQSYLFRIEDGRITTISNQTGYPARPWHPASINISG